MSHKKKKKKRGEFEILATNKQFAEVIQEDGYLNLRAYIKSWSLLNKAFLCFGTIFKFVYKDIESDLKILNKHLNETSNGVSASDSHSTQISTNSTSDVETINFLLDYEIQRKITTRKKPLSATIALVRLHRSLDFVSKFVKEIREADYHDATSKIAWRVYHETIYKYHTYWTQRLVRMAVALLPNRKKLEADLAGELEGADLENATKDLINHSERIYNATQKVLKKRNLQDLNAF